MTIETPPERFLLSVSDEEFECFRRLIHKETGIFLKDGKRALLAARLARRLRQLNLAALGDYYAFLMRQDPRGEERRRMVNCITTNKTSFFRENHHFQFLQDWLARKVRESPRPQRLNIWSAACSSGEEPYSIAITISEALGNANGWNAVVLASDIDTDMLERAEAGIYDSDGLAEVSEVYKRKYFLRGKGDWEGLVQVKPEVRRTVFFERVNLIDEAWPIQARFDAIFCRNVIIYFDRDTQRRLFERLVAHLLPDGYLFVGHSESLYWLADVLAPVHQTVYRLRGAGAAR